MFIGVVGCMGVGKSRLTEALAKRLGYRAYFEPVKENPYLDDFYADPKRWAVLMQFFMLTRRFHQHLELRELRQKDIGIVQDQIIFGDVLYATLNHQMGNIDIRDFENYKTHFEALRPLLALPDVIIHLETSIDTVLNRIKERGRASEQAISREYLQALTELFDAWVTSVEDQTHVLRLDWTSYQPVDEVVKTIEDRLQVQLPLPVTNPSSASPATA